MTIKLVLDQPRIMKTVVDAMVPVSDDVAIEISENGFRAQARQEGAAWAVDVFLDKELFENITAPSPVIFHVDLKDFSDFIKTARSNDKLEITDNLEKGTLDIKLSSKEITKYFSLRLNNVENYRFMKIMDRPFLTYCIIDTDLFADAIKAAELGEAHVSIKHNREKLHFVATSPIRTAEAVITYPNDKVEAHHKSGQIKVRDKDGNVIDMDITEDFTHEATYGLKFLKHISKIGRSDSKLKLSMNHQQPIRLVYQLETEGDEIQSYIAFAVAPRVKID